MIDRNRSFSPSESDRNFTKLVTVAIVTALVVGLGEFFWITLNYRNSFNQQLESLSQQAEKRNSNSTAQSERIIALEAEVNKLQSQVNDLKPIPNIDSSLNEKAVGYIKLVYDQSGKKYLDIDYVQWLSGEAARAAAIEDKGCKPEECIPNGYYIRNRNAQLRTYEISEKAIVLSLEGDLTQGKAITLKHFIEIFEDTAQSTQWLRESLYDIEVKEGIVTRIAQRYQP